MMSASGSPLRNTYVYYRLVEKGHQAHGEEKALDRAKAVFPDAPKPIGDHLDGVIPYGPSILYHDTATVARLVWGFQLHGEYHDRRYIIDATTGEIVSDENVRIY